jgi:protein-S-isoprenylcysteine O-methyltransferase Ste14
MGDHRVGVLIRGAVVATLFVTLWVWLATLVQRFDALLDIVPPEWLGPVGWLIGVAGAAICLTCVVLFVTVGRGTPAPFDPPKVFVAIGPYRYLRNPMYVGAILALLGGGLVVRSFSILALAAGFWLLAHLMVVLYEEPVLERRFGESFVAYKRQTNRWLPRLPDRP